MNQLKDNPYLKKSYISKQSQIFYLKIAISMAYIIIYISNEKKILKSLSNMTGIPCININRVKKKDPKWFSKNDTNIHNKNISFENEIFMSRVIGIKIILLNLYSYHNESKSRLVRNNPPRGLETISQIWNFQVLEIIRIFSLFLFFLSFYTRQNHRA